MRAAQSTLGWFAPPALERPDLQRRARALWLVSWPFFAVVTLVLAVAVVIEPSTLGRRAVTVGAVAALMLLLHTVSRAGRPVLASWLLVIGLSVIVTQRAWITGGIHAPVAVFYAIFIVMGGLLIGVRGGVITAFVCFAGAVLLATGTAAGWLTARPGAGSALAGFVFVLLAIGMAVVLQWIVALRPRGNPLTAQAVQMLVHDMRSPMQVMLMHLDLLRDDIRGERATHVEGAIGSAMTINRLANSLLDVSRFEAGKMAVHRVTTDLFGLSSAVVGTVRVLQPARTITVSASGDPSCSCDPELTRRVIENLVSNALKHTAEDRAVTVSVTGTANHVTVAVRDDGQGIAPDRLHDLFEPFAADGLRSANGFECSGLGLAFCRLAVEAQGGSIRFEPGEPRGSAFIVSLPR